MTRSIQKYREQHYADCASNLLGEAWTIYTRESPDFAITSEGSTFGLEIREISSDIESEIGSKLKQGEGERRKRLSNLRENFRKCDGTPLSIKFLLDLNKYRDDEILQILRDMNLGKKPKGYQSCFEFPDGGKICATHAFTDQWVFVPDQVGWVLTDRTTEGEYRLKQIFGNAIDQKAQKIDSYAENGFDVVRLILVANGIYNSGKVVLTKEWRLDPKGFSVVYFLNYPDSCEIIAKPTY